MNNSPAVESTNQIITYLKQKGIAHLSVDNDKIQGNVLGVQGKELINFGSCSYLGLEFDQRMKSGAEQALNNYGTQFSASRAYVSAGSYEQLEAKLCKIFGGYVLVTPTTTLGHISTIPIIIGRNDCVIMDHQVHNSVQTAVKLVKADGTHVELIRHNRMDLLEKRLNEIQSKYENVWYMADGIYSMYGDKAPMKELERLLNTYENFHLYVDDAHAMSCFGKHGRGYALSEIDLHPKMVMGTSLNKAFASGGGAFVFPTREMYDRVRNCGGPMITSGPMQPAALGAALAAADIHLSDDIYDMQKELRDNILYCHRLLEEYGLPNLAEKDSPIFFIGVGAPGPAYDLIDRLISNGFLVNIGIFPAVPMKNTGLRFTITRLHTFEQIESFVSSLAYQYYKVLRSHDTTIQDVCKAFKIEQPSYSNVNVKSTNAVDSEVTVELYQTIIDVEKEEWNRTLGRRSSFDWTALNIIEHSFSNNAKTEHNWDFEYLTLRDENGEIILSTFLTSGIMKDDMLLERDISINLEKIRVEMPHYGTSKFLSVGCFITEGNHVYMNEQHPLFKDALQKFYVVIDELQKKHKATQIILRDLPADNNKMDDVMVDNGYFKVQMPDNFILDLSTWDINDCYTSILKKKARKHFRTNVLSTMENFEVRTVSKVDESTLAQYYSLYKNVQTKNMDINTFDLPFTLFQSMNESKNWEFIELKLKPEFNKNGAVAVVFAYKGEACYCPTMMGIDYSLDRELNTYRQAIYQVIRAGKIQGYDQIRLGFSAGMEKRKFGAKGHESVAYMQSADHFNMEAILSSNSEQAQELVSIES